jgi:hypothetical protein
MLIKLAKKPMRDEELQTSRRVWQLLPFRTGPQHFSCLGGSLPCQLLRKLRHGEKGGGDNADVKTFLPHRRKLELHAYSALNYGK